MNGYHFPPQLILVTLWTDPSLTSPTTQRLPFLQINHA